MFSYWCFVHIWSCSLQDWFNFFIVRIHGILPVLSSVLQEHCEMPEKKTLCSLNSFCNVSTNYTQTPSPLSTHTGGIRFGAIRLSVQKQISPMFPFQNNVLQLVLLLDWFEQIFIATFLNCSMLDLARISVSQFVILNCLVFGSRSPLWVSHIKTMFCQCKTVVIVMCSLTKLRQCEQHCVCALSFRKWEFKRVLTSYLMRKA